MKKISTLLFTLFIGLFATAQIQLGGETDFSVPKEYVVGGITVLGTETTEVQAVKLFAGINVGEKITVPGEKISTAIRNLWRQDLFGDVQIYSADVRGEEIFLVIKVEERNRLTRFSFKGVSKSDSESLKERVQLVRGKVINENLIQRAENSIRKYYVAKGFLNAKVNTVQKGDTGKLYDFGDKLDFTITKGDKIKINEISFDGISAFSEKKLERSLKDTKEKKWWRIFKRSKFTESNFKDDKQNLIAMFNKKGYRNVKILSDTVWNHDEKTINVHLNILEDKKFFFRDISWFGNTIYSDEQLGQRLGIFNGDTYNEEKLQERLFQSPTGGDVSSLYLDNGYLSFNATPVETLIEGDSIDIEIRMYEGKQYRIGKISIIGNTITNDHVILREIRTKPGDLFSRSDIIRTQRELSNLGYFDPEQFGVNPKQNPQDGTVDIEYTVVERPSDQIELSGGWGAGRVVGTLGLSFNNFSLKKAFTEGSKAWRPVPKGDGQQFSIRAQSNGQFFQAYTLSFVEPWLGGKKPNSFSVSLSHSIQTNGLSKFITSGDDKIDNPERRDLGITGITLGLGQRWQKPDDWFVFRAALSYQYYDLNNFGNIFSFASGFSNNAALQLQVSRNSVNAPIFPTSGSDVGFTFKGTLPYSAFSKKDFATATDQEKFKWIEYHKWKFTSAWYTTIAGSGDNSYSEKARRSLVLYAKTGHGYLGSFNPDIGASPFERFYLGGSALTGFQLDGREIIALRGYDDNSISPQTGATFISKYTTELRYPLSLNPSATIYMLAFAEAGNTWNDFKDYNPFELNKSAGVGMRVFLPMFGLLGLDYGWRFDDIPSAPTMAKSQFHFTIGTNLGEL